MVTSRALVGRHATFFLFTEIFLFSGIHGCVTTQAPYIERHQLSNLTVVFIDEDSLQQKWKAVSETEAIRYASSAETMVSVQIVKGFYDFTAGTIYCEK